MNWSVHFSLVSFSLFFLVWGEAPPSLVAAWDLCFHFPNLMVRYGEPCRILWTLQFCVLCPSPVHLLMWGQVSHLTLGDSHQRNVMRFWCLSYLVISCHILLSWHFPVFFDPVSTSPHLCYAGLIRTARLATNCFLLDIERYPEIRLCHVCKIHVQYVQYGPICPFQSISCTSPEDELNELNLHTIQRQSSPRHEVEPMDFGAVSPEFFGASATTSEIAHVMCDLVRSCDFRTEINNKWTSLYIYIYILHH